MTDVSTTFEQCAEVCEAALVRSGCTKDNAVSVARAIAWAEATANRVCGLFYLPVFVEQLQAGIVDGQAQPTLSSTGSSSLVVDAKGGFAHPAIAIGLPALVDAAHTHGAAALAVRNSTNCLSLAHHVIPLAEAGLVGLCTSNAPASVAPPGAAQALFGTNPFSFSVPGREGPRLVIDQSTSATTMTAVLRAAQANEPIPDGWAQNPEGLPTNDTQAGIDGALLPFGGQKGANVSLIVEILSAVMTASTLSAETGAFSGQITERPTAGQFFIALDPRRFAGDEYESHLDRLCALLTEQQVRLPGLGRLRPAANTPITVPEDEWRQALSLAGR